MLYLLHQHLAIYQNQNATVLRLRPGSKHHTGLDSESLLSEQMRKPEGRKKEIYHKKLNTKTAAKSALVYHFGLYA